MRSYGSVQCPPTLLPSSSTEWVVWKDCEFLKNEKCEKGERERKRELSSVGI